MKVEYNNLYTHFVFITYLREKVIPEKNRQRIEKFITGVIKNYSCKLYSIYANPDRVHFLVSRAANISEEYLAKIVADASEKFINENKLSARNFKWQRSCGAFSVSKKDIPKVCTYIENQPEHHKKTTFAEEYDKFIEYYEKTILPENKVN